jgi:hypothetical protein
MSTSVSSGLESLQRRFSEIDLILSYASEKEKTYELYTTLCRSAQVLLIAHFEGAVKQFVRDVINDFNQSNFEFKDSPNALKHTFCSFFIKENNDSVRFKLLDTFNSVPVKYTAEAFLFNNHSDNNRNPNPYVVNNILERFGVSSFLSQIENSDLDVAFEDSKSSQIAIRDKMKFYLIENVKHYPYTVDLKLFNINFDKNMGKRKSRKKSMWEEFLDEVMTKRHNIAHGNSLESQCSHTEIERSKLKIEILIYAYILLLCKFSAPS